MSTRLTTTFIAITTVLAVGEVANAVMIRIENYPDAQPLFAVVFGLLFLVGAWLASRQRLVAGSVLVGLLCLVEILGFPGWTRHRAVDWVVQTGYAGLSMAGLVLAVLVLVSRRRARTLLA